MLIHKEQIYIYRPVFFSFKKMFVCSFENSMIHISHLLLVYVSLSTILTQTNIIRKAKQGSLIWPKGHACTTSFLLKRQNCNNSRIISGLDPSDEAEDFRHSPNLVLSLTETQNQKTELS